MSREFIPVVWLTTQNRISYFMKKFRKSYEKTEAEYESREEFNSRRV